MGKKHKRANKFKPKEETKKGVRGEYDHTIPRNEDFEKYYIAQNLMDNSEFELFMNTLREPLPVSFRITGSRSHAGQLRDYMKSKLFPALENLIVDDKVIPAPRPLEWYPDNLGWIYEVGRQHLRRAPSAGEFHKFLVSETEVGNISRQEAVSMVPVLFLDVKPGQYVLDLCAAPGSKTAQLLENILGDSNEFPDGLVIANDVDQKRAYMLVHQAKRLQTPCLLVTNHPAQDFPKLIIQDENNKKRACQFDRVLCDVPCSGDGTIRKNRTIWNTWKSANGNGLHKLQRQILLRGLELLKKDGIMVYSTCTFNPIENEAVIASVLSETNGAFELVDVSNDLPLLHRKPGISTWKVQGKDGLIYETYVEGTGVQVTMFPPANISELNLERCQRIYPHLLNGGGFFFAVIRKRAEYGSLDKFNFYHQSSSLKRKFETTEEKLDVEEDETVDAPSIVGWAGGSRESPFVSISDENPTIAKCRSDYGLGKSFPRDLFFVRSEGKIDDFSSIYVVSQKVKEVLTAENSSNLKVVNTGVKLFVKNAGKNKYFILNSSICQYRVCSEGVQTISPHLTKDRQIVLPIEDLLVMIEYEYPKIDQLSENAQKTLKEISHGSCILHFNPTAETVSAGTLKEPLALPFFRAHVSVSLLLNKKERTSMYHRLTGEVLQEIIGIEQDADKTLIKS